MERKWYDAGMSHSFEASGGTVFNANSDLSGCVTIQTRGGLSFDVPATDLLEFVGNHVLNQARARLDDMSPLEVLTKLPPIDF